MSDSQKHFVVPTKYYIGTFVALLFLTIVTVAISRVDLGVLNVPVALFIAFVKMTFVLLFFMGLKWDKPMSSILMVSSLFCIAIFLYFTFADIAFRGDVFPEEEGVHNIKSPVQVVSPAEYEMMFHQDTDKKH